MSRIRRRVRLGDLYSAAGCCARHNASGLRRRVHPGNLYDPAANGTRRSVHLNGLYLPAEFRSQGIGARFVKQQVDYSRKAVSRHQGAPDFRRRVHLGSLYALAGAKTRRAMHPGNLYAAAGCRAHRKPAVVRRRVLPGNLYASADCRVRRKPARIRRRALLGSLYAAAGAKTRRAIHPGGTYRPAGSAARSDFG